MRNKYDLIHDYLQQYKEVWCVLEYIKKNIQTDVYVCGGCIRDYFMSNESKDFDIFVDITQSQLFNLLGELKRYGNVEIGQYGSPRIITNDEQFVIDIIPFYNFIVGDKICSINDLLNNFDITANALGIGLKSKSFFNPLNGIDDIGKRIIRAVRFDFPERFVSNTIPISTVSVFWFRLLNYGSKLDFVYDNKTLEWIIDNKFRWKDRFLYERYFNNLNLNFELYSKII